MSTDNELSAIQRGYYTREELFHVLPSRERVEKGRVAVIECIEEIPCNPCAGVCPVNGVQKEGLSVPPLVLPEKCIGCTKCIAVCPGLAIFNMMIKDGKGYVTMPYEFSPEPTLGDKVTMFDRGGNDRGVGTIVQPTYKNRGDSRPRWIVTVEMDDPDLSYMVRDIKVLTDKKDP
jgi:ferredoxin